MSPSISYTGRDLAFLEDEIDRYIQAFFPEIKDSARSSFGRRLLSLHAALTDPLHFYLDKRFLNTNLTDSTELSAAINLARDMHYFRQGPVGSRTTLKLATIQGVAGGGGIAIPQWTLARTKTTPPIDFLTLVATSILEGESSVEVEAVQGTRKTDVILAAGSTGEKDQLYEIPTLKPELALIEFFVDGIGWTRKPELWDSRSSDQHFMVYYDSEDRAFVKTGDGEFGAIPTAGSEVKTNYITTLGEAGRVGKGEVAKLMGALAIQLTVTNTIEATGGSNGDTLATIKRRAPASLKTAWRAVTGQDLEALAEEFTGVHAAKALVEGAKATVYILPDGGGQATQTLLDDLKDFLETRRLIGGKLATTAVGEAELVAQVEVWLDSRDIDRAATRSAILKALTGSQSGVEGILHYSKVKIGGNFSMTALARAIEGVTGVSEADIFKMTRRPKITKSNAGAPDFFGDITITEDAAEVTWLLTALDGTTYRVSREGTVESEEGTRGVAYTPGSGEVSWQLGTTAATLTAGDTWKFKAPRYRGNVKVESSEIVVLKRAADLKLDFKYEGED